MELGITTMGSAILFGYATTDENVFYSLIVHDLSRDMTKPTK